MSGGSAVVHRWGHKFIVDSDDEMEDAKADVKSAEVYVSQNNSSLCYHPARGKRADQLKT
jgi:hypothetical protein